MTSDIKLIQELTKHTPGDLYVCDNKGKISCKIDRYDDKLYDETTGNFHILPEPEPFLKEINSVRKLIVEKMEKEYGEENVTNGSAKNLSYPMKLEQYIGVTITINDNKTIKYMICFERLFIENENQVSSILGLFQFYKYPSADKYINRVKKDEKGRKKFFKKICYPDTSKDNAYKTIESDNGEHKVYNPEGLPGVFETDETNVNKVCSAFIEFIKKENIK